MKRLIELAIAVSAAVACGKGQRVVLGDEQFGSYLPLLQDKRVALFSNHTGLVGDRGPHIADALIDKGVHLTVIFSPEHGFRGDADAGERVGSGVDPQTGVPILSLYGGGEPDTEVFDVLVADIQDVGLRYYTYYITLMRLIDACAGAGKPVIILDRPNPNGFYVDGPLLDPAYRSGVGGLPVPIVHGMTLGELALMARGEGWIAEDADITVIPCKHYSHRTRYRLVLPPSPNLKNMQAVWLYASTCYFEGTVVSLGRGTEYPFQIYGHPDMHGDFTFTPRSMIGAKHPPFEGVECRGRDLRTLSDADIQDRGINFEYVVEAYTDLGLGEAFFPGGGRFFDLLTGSDKIRKMILRGASAAEIEASWQQDAAQFRRQRKPYLLYKDS